MEHLHYYLKLNQSHEVIYEFDISFRNESPP